MKNIVLFIFAVSLLTACTSKPPSEQYTSVDSLQGNVVKLTSVQYKASNIVLGKMERRPVAGSITVNGKLDVPPQNVTIISPPWGGFVNAIYILPGMPVKKGDVLAVLQNQEYIQLQQDYLDNVSKLEFLEKEYERQVELARENVNAQKSLQQSKAQYGSMKAIVNGLEAKLAMIHISTASLQNGKISSTIALRSPVNGFVTTVNVSTGQFVTATDVLFKMVSLQHIHVELQVYEKDIHKISTGQKVTFHLANDTTCYDASVYLVGKEIGADRTVQVHCDMNREHQSLLPGMFVTARIETASDTENVVPTEAIANYEGKSYIFVSSGSNVFRAVPVRTGNSTGSLIPIYLSEPEDEDIVIVTRGAFELMGLLKNKQE
jgi:cobalt-zinc-cadmium efflux system membrane fusion protein